MNNLTINTELRMSHIEIAKMAGKRPDHTKSVVKDLVEKCVIQSPEIRGIQIASGKTVKAYMLNKRESYILIARLSPEFTGKLVDRWLELEEKNNRPTVPQNYLEALQHLVEREKELIVTRPKAEYHDKVLDTSNCMTISVIAKDLGMSGMKLNKLLSSLRIQYKQGRQWLLYSEYQDKGYVDTSTYHNGSDSTYHNTVWTEKGRQFIINQLKKAELI